MNDFYKFPSTKHLTIFQMNIREEKVMSDDEQRNFLKNEIYIEEKIDGANLGISFDKDANILLQNRGEYLTAPYIHQWKHLPEWLEFKRDLFFDILSDRYILFGEWCYASHTIHYNNLPDWFIGFDIFDKKDLKFLSSIKRNEMFEKIKIERPPFILYSKYGVEFSELLDLIDISNFGLDIMEGLYLRLDKNGYLEQRAKLINPFILHHFYSNNKEHWKSKPFRRNFVVRRK